MISKAVLASVTVLCLLAGPSQLCAAVAQPLRPFSTAITAQGLRAADEVISSDAMEGRKPGTSGETRATAWIVDQFKEAGLRPGNAGSWFQAVDYVNAVPASPAGIRLDVRGKAGQTGLRFGPDFVAMTLQGRAHVSLSRSPIVFLGYGIDAPAYGWNDYRDTDVRGKVVIVLVNDPGQATGDPALFKGKAMTIYGRWTYKYEEAARHGAAACLVVHTSDVAAGYPWTAVRNTLYHGKPVLADPASLRSQLPVAGWLTAGAAREMFAAAGLNFDELAKAASSRKFRPVDLNATADLTLDSTVTRETSNNVIGVLDGTSLRDQAVAYSAHWDHFGTDPSLKGHPIYNGAVDDGVGVAMLVSIARAFGSRPEKPRRSVLFIAFTLEEAGLLGSEHYAKHPVFPIAKTVADINMDADAVIGLTRNLQVIGSGQSDIEDVLKNVLAEQHRTVSTDHADVDGVYFRSDHFNFAKVGVPALMTATGNDLVKGGTALGNSKLADYGAHRYHTPRDVFEPDWDFTGVAADTQALYEVGRRLADGDAWPQWRKGSDFSRKQ